MTATSLAPALWEPPAAVRVRGALAVIAGAGEGVRVYERFGKRLSSDGYIVAVFETAQATDAAAWLADAGVEPRVVVGSDLGAAAALRLAAESPVDGVIVAGLPSPAGAAEDAGTPEARTACPVHLGVLGEAGARATAPAPHIDLPGAEELAALTSPVLAVHGGADPLTPLAAAREALAVVPTLEFVETVGGLHDALNDQSHRSVAATIVLWLERLRSAGVEAPIVREVAA